MTDKIFFKINKNGAYYWKCAVLQANHTLWFPNYGPKKWTESCDKNQRECDLFNVGFVTLKEKYGVDAILKFSYCCKVHFVELFNCLLSR